MDDEMMKMMGFSSFGMKKSTMGKDEINAAFEKSKRSATSPKKPDSQLPELPTTQPDPKAHIIAPTSNIDSNTAVLPEKDDFGPTIQESNDDSDMSDEEDEPQTIEDMFPISHEIQLKDHSKVVSAVALDPAGARLITGSHDCFVKMWDFAGMDQNFRPFRSLEPCGGNPITDLSFSLTGEHFLVASGEWVPKLYHRDGELVYEYQKGDMYIRDRRNTKGHVASLSSIRWHPHEKGIFLTTSGDSTVRIWDVEEKRSQKSVIFVKSKVRGGLTRITSGAFSPDGKLIAAGAEDGALRIWSTSGPFISPSKSLENAHQPYNAITSVLMASDNFTVVTRCMDETLKIFDLRNFKTAVAGVTGLPNYYEETNVIFSPDEKYMFTGVSVKKGDSKPGHLVVIDRATCKPVQNIAVGPGSVVKTLWHSKINQLVVSMGSGAAHVLYDPNSSQRGAKLCALKEPKRRTIEDSIDLQIYTPDSIPLLQEEMDSEPRRRGRIRADPLKTRKPEMPYVMGGGLGKGGKIGSSLTAHLMKGIIKDTSRDEDPREAFLRHAKDAEDDPFWVNPAYKKTQPKPVLAKHVHEDEEEAAMDSKKKRRQ